MPKDIDPHRNAVYQWEASWPEWNRNLIGLPACRKLVWAVCDHHKVPRPTVVEHSGGSYAWSMPAHNRISIQGGEHLQRGSRNVPTALHEAAHHIAWHKYGEKIQDHGPTFLGLYMDLLERAQVAPRVALEATARSHQLKWR